MELAITKKELVEKLTKQVEREVDYLVLLNRKGETNTSTYWWAIGRRGLLDDILTKVCELTEAEVRAICDNAYNKAWEKRAGK